ncbi:MAG: DUF962 domain-containing protein [Bacteroidetes bacterium]|nr:DUF962 domain-containing protein [Bacteroidota bacterium]
MLGNRPWTDWINEYSKSHQNPANRLCHIIGIPLIVLSIVMLPLALFFKGIWMYSLAFFLIGWAFQFIGHAFERKAPEFFKDWRFLFVGVRWWIQKVLLRKDKSS